MADRFSACLAETLRWEGGYSDDKHDPGGKTMRGVIQSEYDAYRRKRGLPTQWVKQISEDELRDIYRSGYWVPVRADELPPGLDLEVWDFAVNSGPVTAVRKLQQVLGIVADGHIGNQTIDAVHQSGDVHGLIEKYMAARRAYLRSLRTFRYFGKGWMSRCDGVEHAALAACRGVNVHPIDDALENIPQPDADPGIQAAQIGKAPAGQIAPPATTQATLTLGGLGGLSTAMPSIIGRAASGGKVTATGLLWAVLQEPLFWVGCIALFGAVTTFLWRRKHQTA